MVERRTWIGLIEFETRSIDKMNMTVSHYTWLQMQVYRACTTSYDHDTVVCESLGCAVNSEKIFDRPTYTIAVCNHNCTGTDMRDLSQN